jgi:hypothetical protein
VFNRNKPVDMLMNAQAFAAYAGFVSKRTLLEHFAPFVSDVDEELERLEEEGDIFADSPVPGEADLEED